MDDWKNKALAVLIVALLLATPAMAVQYDDDVEEDDARPLPLLTGFKIYAGMFAVFFGNTLAQTGMDLIGFGGGGVPLPADVDDAVMRYVSTTEIVNTANNIATISALSSSLIANDTQTWSLSESYLNRLAEISAGANWNETAEFDADALLEFASIYNLIATGDGNTQNALDQTFLKIGSRLAEWEANSDYTDLDFSIGFVWDGGTTGRATSGDVTLDFGTVVTASEKNNKVYLAAEYGKGSTDSFGDPYSRNIVSFQPNASVLKNISTGDSYQILPGYNDLSAMNLTDGWYTLSPGRYVGPFYPSTDNTVSATCEGGAVIVCNGMLGTLTYNEGYVDILWNDLTYQSTKFAYSYMVGGDVRTTEKESVGSSVDPVSHLIQTYAEYYGQLTERLNTSAQAALVMWKLSSSAKESNILLSPSSVIPQLSNLKISADQAYALYVAALDQIATYNNTYGETLSDSATFISDQSMKLYCQGDIYGPGGEIIASNVIYTPYVFTKDFTVITGKNQFGQQPGMLMVWSDKDLDSWNGTADFRQLVVMSESSYFTVDKMIYDGKSVDTLELQVKSIEEIGIELAKGHEPEPVPKVLDAVTLVSIIIVELAIIVAMGALLFKSKLVLLLALIILVVGLIFADPIAVWLTDLIG